MTGVPAEAPGGAERAPAKVAPETRYSRQRAWFAGTAASWYLRACDMTWRKDIAELAKLDQLLADGERVIAVFWHAKYLPLFTMMRGRRASVFASQSFRGRVIAQVCKRLGYECFLLPHRRGSESRQIMRDALRSHQVGALAVDGPLGPARVAKPGVIKLASELGFLLLPVSAAAAPARVLEDRWDRREIPRLFSRVAVAVGEPIRMPPGLDPGDLPAWQAEVGRALDSLDGAVAQRVRDPDAPSDPWLFR